MTEVFISYSTKDEAIAQRFKTALELAGLKVFLASQKIEAGKKWKDEIIKNFKEATWVFFIATKDSCASTAVMHELGGSIFMEKEVIPLMSGIRPEDLPDWIKDTQAIDIENPDSEEVKGLIERIADKATISRVISWGVLLGLGVLFGVCIAKGEK